LIRIRLASPDDVPKVAPLEQAAAEVFRTIGMDAVADDPPIANSVLLQAVEDRRLWVAVEYGVLKAYLLGEFLPRSLHIDQVTVHPDAARRGLGALMIESVSADPRSKRLGLLTLTSFKDVPWNAPYYRRIGFVDIDEPDWPEGVAEKVAAEREQGLDAWPRVVMQRVISEPKAWPPDGTPVEM
jgi:GNAT superfamily N-acetyltransferase